MVDGYWDHRLRSCPVVGRSNHLGPHQEDHDERDHALSLLHRERRCAFHVASQVQAPVRCSPHLIIIIIIIATLANGLEFGCFRYHIPWIIIGICYICCIALLFAIRTLLKRRNDLREAEAVDDTYEDVYVIKTLDNGEKVEVKVAKVCPSFWVVVVRWGY